MDYSNIFNEIVSITHHDYSGWEDKYGWDKPECYLEKITKLENEKKMTPFLFSKIINDYLLDYNDRHIYFTFNGDTHSENRDCGFRVRRYGDKLYVTETTEEKRFTKGTEILCIDGATIKEVHSMYTNKLREAHPERENWNAIIQNAKWCEIIVDNGQMKKIELADYEKQVRDSFYTFKEMDSETLLMTLPDFKKPDAISDLITRYPQTLKDCKYLIIDVRNNSGGMSMAFNPILSYIFPKVQKPTPVIKTKEFNCTERNADLFAIQYEELKEVIQDEDTLKVMEYANKMFQSNKGKGFTTFDFSDFVENTVEEFEGSDSIDHIVILSDYYCGSAGDDFVEICKQSSKVTVIGRATMGVNDFSDLAVMTWNNQFSLFYPTSRLVKKTVSEPTHGTGIQPDIYIPWSPEHIQEDIDLNKAIEITKSLAAINI